MPLLHQATLSIKLLNVLLINMKKIIFIVSVSSLVFFTSCKKDRQCECIEDYNGIVGTPTITTFEKSTRPEARAACHSFSEVLPTGGTRTVKCKLL